MQGSLPGEERKAAMTLNEAVAAIKLYADDACTVVREWANCRECEITDDGEIWISDPQRGHWLDEDAKSEFVAWCHERDRCAPTYAYARY